MDTKSFTQQEWEERKNKIRYEMIYVDVREYSHNIVGLYLNDMSDEDAIRMCRECELGRIGWEHLDDGKASDADKAANRTIFKRRDILINYKKYHSLKYYPRENE